uniref:Uncharacterized protein n=1 Tax=Grammatophora oceanica TaxID=210454 RepID=A0A7S1VUI3_9STRA|mmetsp:Transcript_7218/g.10579  ORF Transcript_7218/g.10579 Transcript_7218/m.10579 type:complete len:389 (+) Transcript_7218:304-1470(+)|eukprot:CAMPEP_0194067192 /NCGR_PEP_ID=MMETSP0009_2-20130614/86427_1 /TAXON_ID=210454 /ORGANISM="Grammatophora oceanica, Strain CCMP 410" /LENGTH=388 /DNA_ID=CAMNT_0038720203 /DNA_START=287 /DNA_END=1453 /DNA_ORIENTATION=-
MPATFVNNGVTGSRKRPVSAIGGTATSIQTAQGPHHQHPPSSWLSMSNFQSAAQDLNRRSVAVLAQAELARRQAAATIDNSYAGNGGRHHYNMTTPSTTASMHQYCLPNSVGGRSSTSQLFTTAGISELSYMQQLMASTSTTTAHRRVMQPNPNLMMAAPTHNAAQMVQPNPSFYALTPNPAQLQHQIETSQRQVAMLRAACVSQLATPHGGQQQQQLYPGSHQHASYMPYTTATMNNGNYVAARREKQNHAGGRANSGSAAWGVLSLPKKQKVASGRKPTPSRRRTKKTPEINISKMPSCASIASIRQARPFRPKVIAKRTRLAADSAKMDQHEKEHGEEELTRCSAAEMKQAKSIAEFLIAAQEDDDDSTINQVVSDLTEGSGSAD